MASLEVTGLDEVIKKLEKYSKKQNVDAMAKRAVEAAKGKVVSTTKAAVGASERGPYSTGSVAASISATAAKVNAYGAYSVARPTGRDSKGVRNAEKAAYLEYGSPKNGPARLAARPWRKRASKAAEGPCVKIMEQIVKKELGAD